VRVQPRPAQSGADLLAALVHAFGIAAHVDLAGGVGAISDRLGAPSHSLDTMMAWIAHWVKHGGRSLGKPTHFEARDGHY
jgi:hypothetical protein